MPALPVPAFLRRLSPAPALARLSPRERRLALLTGGVVFVLGNLLLLNFLLGTRRELSATLASKRAAAATAEALRKEAPMWLAADTWLREHQPRLTVSPQVAGGQLLTQVQGFAGEHRVTLVKKDILPVEAPGPGVAARPYRPIAVSVTVRGDWPAMVNFLAALQGRPEDFLVLETVTLRSESDDANMMRGELRVAKWYAPGGP